MELTTALLGILRIIVLPLICFFIYLKFQSISGEASQSYPGPTHNSHARAKILARRQFVDSGEKPEPLANLCMKTQADAPELFVSSGRPGRGGGGGKRDDRGKADRGGERGGDRGEKRERREKKPEKNDGDEEKENEAPVVKTVSPSEEKMHVESLLNYVAFNKRPHQRTFLPEEGLSPPPPPKHTRPGAPLAGPGEPEISGAAAEQANAEAQMVLRGAIKFKTATVAKDLYEQLVNKQVEISDRTFTLMIEGCVLASDLKAASDFLMKMETSGYSPEPDLLDKVMDLYSQQKVQREQEKQAEPPAEAAEQPAPPAERTPLAPAMEFKPSALAAEFKPSALAATGGGAEAPPEADADEAAGAALGVEESLLNLSSKLSSDAPVFELSSKLSCDAPVFELSSKLSSDAPVFVPSFAPAPPAPPATAADDEEGDMQTSLRTRLVASAKPFEPQFNVTFDPAMYTWTVDPPEEGGDGDDQGKGKKGSSGEGKGKSKGKSKAKEGKSGDEAKTDAEHSTNEKGKDLSGEKSGAKKTGARTWKPKE